MGIVTSNQPAPRPDFARAARRRRSPWQYVFVVIVAVYAAVLASVIWIGAGFGARVSTPTPAPVTLAFVEPTVTPTSPATATPVPTLPPARPTPTVPPPTSTPDPNVDFHVPLAASNTGTIQRQRVAILNITDDARSTAASTRPIAGFKFVTVEVLVENTGDQPVGLGRWQVHTNGNVDVASSPVAGFGSPIPTTSLIAPQSLVTGIIVFSVPANAKLTWIQYLPNPATKGSLYFDIS